MAVRLRAWLTAISRPRSNVLWVADIIDCPTWSGFLYLTLVLDAFSWRIVGWSIAMTLRAKIVLDALDITLWRRSSVGVIHHSDQALSTRPLPSPSVVGKSAFRHPWALSAMPMAESFFATLDASCSTGGGSRRTPRRASHCSSSSKAFTTADLNTHLAILLKGKGVADRDAIPRVFGVQAGSLGYAAGGGCHQSSASEDPGTIG